MLDTDEVTEPHFKIGPMGYDVAEVDRFRATVLEALTARDEAVHELRAQLAAARTGAGREGSSAAARVLELATVNADQLLDEARAEASSLVGAARAEAEQVTADLARHQEEQAAEFDRHREGVLTELADRRATLEARIAALTEQETEHRDRLRSHFAQQLAQLDDDEPAVLRAVAGD